MDGASPKGTLGPGPPFLGGLVYFEANMKFGYLGVVF